MGVVYLYICSFPWTENHSLPKSFLVRVDYRLGILFFLLLLFTFELGSRTSQSNTRSFQMSYRNSVSQNEMRNLTRDVQTTSVSCSEKDVTRSYFDQSAKDSSKHANHAKANTKHSLHRCIFKKPYHSKKVAEEQRKTLNTQLRQKFVSPSDSLLSPCSMKLNDHKSKLFVAKSQPKRLDFARSKQSILTSSNADTELDNDDDDGDDDGDDDDLFIS